MMYNIVLIHSRHNIYTEKSDYAKVSAIPHDTLRIITDMPVILYVITTRCLSFGICQNSHQHSVTILNRIWCFMIEFIIGYKNQIFILGSYLEYQGHVLLMILWKFQFKYLSIYWMVLENRWRMRNLLHKLMPICKINWLFEKLYICDILRISKYVGSFTT